MLTLIPKQGIIFYLTYNLISRGASLQVRYIAFQCVY